MCRPLGSGGEEPTGSSAPTLPSSQEEWWFPTTHFVGRVTEENEIIQFDLLQYNLTCEDHEHASAYNDQSRGLQTRTHLNAYIPVVAVIGVVPVSSRRLPSERERDLPFHDECRYEDVIEQLVSVREDRQRRGGEGRRRIEWGRYERCDLA